MKYYPETQKKVVQGVTNTVCMWVSMLNKSCCTNISLTDSAYLHPRITHQHFVYLCVVPSHYAMLMPYYVAGMFAGPYTDSAGTYSLLKRLVTTTFAGWLIFY